MQDHPAAALLPIIGEDESVTIHNAMTSNPRPKNDNTPASTAAVARKRKRRPGPKRKPGVKRLPAKPPDPTKKDTYSRYGTPRPSKAKKNAVWGRPPTVPYDPELGVEICLLIASGAALTEAIRELCGEDTELTRRIVYGWTLSHSDFGALYAQACEKRVQAFENDILEIADDADRDYRETLKGGRGPDKELILRSKIRIEGRQWIMSRRNPQQWGDKQSVDVSGNIMLLSPEERVQKALQLFDLTEKFVERHRAPVNAPLVYDPGDEDLPPP
jgi:hypothetical protein